MIARRVSRAAAFTRRDAVRLVVSVAILAALVTAVLSIDLLPTATFQTTVNEPSPVDIYAPRAVQYTSEIQTTAQQQAARAAVAPQYDYTAARGQAFAAQQVAALQNEVAPIDAAFSARSAADARHAALAAALPDLSTASRATLLDLDATGMDRPSRPDDHDPRGGPVGRGPRHAPADRARRPRPAPPDEHDRRSARPRHGDPDAAPGGRFELRRRPPRPPPRMPPRRRWRRSSSTSPRASWSPLKGAPLTPADIEEIDALGFTGQPADTFRIAGWFVLAVLVIGTLLAWLWRFRPELWHRTNTLVLLGLL